MSNEELIKCCGTFATWFSNSCYQADYSVKDIASRMRVTITTVYNWKRGKTMPGSWAQLKEVCRILGTDPEPAWEKFYK